MGAVSTGADGGVWGVASAPPPFLGTGVSGGATAGEAEATPAGSLLAGAPR